MKNHITYLVSKVYDGVNIRKRLFILSLHRIDGNSNISSKNVKEQLAYLARNYKVITPNEYNGLEGNSRLAMVTIDDCHYDTYEKIFPIALDLKIPITICIPTDFVFRNKWLWFDKIKHALRVARPGINAYSNGYSFKTGDKRSEHIFYRNLKLLHPRKRDSIIESAMQKIEVELPENPIDGYKPIPEEILKDMVSTGFVELASHSVSHPTITLLNQEEMMNELAASKKELEDFSGKEVSAFCYPGAPNNFDDRSKDELKKAGYRMAFTTIEGINYNRCFDPYELMRIHAHPDFRVFMKMISGLGDIQKNIGLYKEKRKV